MTASTGLFLTVLAVLVALSIGSKPKVGITAILDGYYYFTDDSTTARNWTEAVAYCATEDAEIAKVTTSLQFNMLRNEFKINANYWIDGQDSDDYNRFELSDACSPSDQEMDFTRLPKDSIILAKNCLRIKRAANKSTLESAPCSEKSRILCGFPADTGCVPPVTDVPTSTTEDA